jgi:DNA-binding SARP family transcriptional activator
MTLEVKLLGRPEARVFGQPLALSGKPLALLYRLAVRPATRAEAASLLWGDDGSQSLRQALVGLRKLPGADAWLEDDELLSVDGAVDSRAFEDAARSGNAEHALASYTGPFLEGFSVGKASEFQDWLEVERARLEQVLAGVLRVQASNLEEARPLEALELTERLLRIDPLDESAVQTALRLEVRLGRRDAATTRLAAFRRALRAELGGDALPYTLSILEGSSLPHPPSSDLSSLALRLARARHLEPSLAQDAAFWAQVLEVDAFSLAEAATELETATPSPTDLEIPPSVRSLLHHRIASSLESRLDESAPDASSFAFTVARHWLLAFDPRAALPWWTRASSLALKSGRVADAEKALFRALWITEDELARRDALVSLSQVADAKNDVSLLHAISVELLRLGAVLQDDLTLFHGHRGRASWLVRSTRAVEAIEASDEALGIARRLQDPELLALAYGTSGGAQMSAGHLEPARAAFLEAERTQNPQLKFRALANLGSISGMLGRFEDSLQYLESALTLSRAMQNLPTTSMILFNLGATAIKLGRLERAEAGFREASQIAERLGNTALVTQGTLALLQVHSARGHWGAAFNTASEALEFTQGTPFYPQAQYLMGQLEARFNRLDAAAELYESALEAFRDAGNARLVLSVEVAQALLALQRGAEGAEEPVRRKLEALRDAGHVDQFDQIRLEYAFLTARPDALRWALEGLPEFQVIPRMARTRLAWLEGKGLDTSGLHELLESAFASENYAELSTGYALLADALEAAGDATGAVRARVRAKEARLESASGLPRVQRAAYLRDLE